MEQKYWIKLIITIFWGKTCTILNTASDFLKFLHCTLPHTFPYGHTFWIIFNFYFLKQTNYSYSLWFALSLPFIAWNRSEVNVMISGLLGQVWLSSRTLDRKAQNGQTGWMDSQTSVTWPWPWPAQQISSSTLSCTQRSVVDFTFRLGWGPLKWYVTFLGLF